MTSGRKIDRRTVLKAGAAALGSSLTGLSWAQTAGDTLTMGVLSQQTGTFAYAGDLVLKGTQLALEERQGAILGKKINLLVRDDEGKPAVGVRRLTEAVSSDKLRYFLGNFSSAVGLAELEVARQEQVLQYAAGGSEDFTGSRCSPYTFQWSAHAYTALRATLEYVSKTLPDKKKIYTITADYAFGQSLLHYTQVAAKELGLQLVGNDNHPSGERQFTQYFTKALSTRPDIICLLTAGADAVTAVRQFNSFGVKNVQIVGPWTLEVEQLRELSPAMRSGMILGLNYYQDIDTPVNKSFVERYLKAYKNVPSYAAAYGYDATRTLLLAMDKAKSVEVAAVMKALEGMQFDSIFGPTTIDARTHQTVRPYYVVQCKAPDAMKNEFDLATIVAQGDKPQPPELNECKRTV
ncbi:ABC transporter substrate-binding protein [Bordetella sp. LUAb4]|uniref:ABC transporter substrate-binding protein n=1 Tax=Bordetella sp. LUAb4 TaxID=2843195 RepID=UPI001E325002|nr:ABC transporter substrate-binding protein [Bordetella sp. LUAb4]